MKTKFIYLPILALLFFSSCLKDKVDSESIYYSDEDYKVISAKLDLPELPDDYQFGSSALATLGRVLFYDKNLSSTKEISCASCHLQEKAFADDEAFSHGVNGLTERNSIGLFGGFVYYSAPNSFFWDERAKTMEEQPEMTITNSIEMDMTMNEVVDRLKKEDHYSILFEKAFRTDEIDGDRVSAALVHFVRSITSDRSKYDEELKNNGFFVGNGASFKGYTDDENLGMQLYQENCSSCHGTNLNPIKAIANNGLDVEYVDKGVGLVTNRTSDNGVFKVPLIRNVELTGPFMHDGRFETLEEVIDFYSEGIQNNPNLDRILLNNDGNPKHMNFSDNEKDALIAFLKTLTDEKLIADERYSDPFK